MIFYVTNRSKHQYNLINLAIFLVKTKNKTLNVKKMLKK